MLKAALKILAVVAIVALIAGFLFVGISKIIMDAEDFDLPAYNKGDLDNDPRAQPYQR